jgi:hypothetical protein
VSYLNTKVYYDKDQQSTPIRGLGLLHLSGRSIAGRMSYAAYTHEQIERRCNSLSPFKPGSSSILIIACVIFFLLRLMTCLQAPFVCYGAGILQHTVPEYRTDLISPRKNIIFCPAG